MSQHLSRAIRELQALQPSLGLMDRTLQLLPRTKSNRVRRSLAAVAVIAIVAIGAGFVLTSPGTAVAHVLDSIQTVIESRVRHTREYEVINDREVLLGERWDRDLVTRRYSLVPEYEDETSVPLRRIPTGKSILTETWISDGKHLLRLEHHYRLASLVPYTDKYPSSGFDLDSVLREMRADANLGSVEISETMKDGQRVLIAGFSNKLAAYRLFCNAETRLPFKMEIVRRPLWPGDRAVRNVRYYDFPTEIDPELFSMIPPKGYRLTESK